MAGAAIGVLKTAAKRAGLAVDVYRSLVASGRKFCWRCRAWHPREVFTADRTRTDGLNSSYSESRNRAERSGYKPRPRISKRGAFYAETRDGDKRQARARVNHHVDVGLLPDPNDLPCADCGHSYRDGERRHEYDHYLGYGAADQLHVQAVCTTCHRRREETR